MKNRYKNNFKRLAEIEPKLLMLEAKIESCALKSRGRKDFCANAVWYGYGTNAGFKKELKTLVGFEAFNSNPVLNTQEAYSTAYNYLYYLLPKCGDCFCMQG